MSDLLPSGANSIGWLFPALAFTTWVGVPIYAAWVRGRLYAAFAGVILTLSLPAGRHRLTARFAMRADSYKDSAQTDGMAFSVLAPGLWLLPLGGLLKNLPVLALIAVHGLLGEER